MITMILIVIAVFYVLAFLAVTFMAPNWGARVAGWLLLLSPIIWKTWDIPIGQHKFKKLCEQEAGIKIYVQNPKLAKRIRLEGNEFSDSTADKYFQFYPSIQQIEAKDKEYSYVYDPIAYALYERDGKGKVVSKLMDTVDKSPPKTRVTHAASSKAEYFLSYEIKKYPYRTTLYRYTLRSADNTVIGTVTNIYHAWSKPENTLLGRAFNVKYCGSDKEYELIQLIAPKGRK
ncbi:MAG TPA: hypothetical protein PLN25_11920 [Deltaproteobacteria bacterium]|nr:hypothetical protein [Deltaproteobacteria bacterium]HQB39208.1 hypothetical protein [Deltaproteobacteria bacterium]